MHLAIRSHFTMRSLKRTLIATVMMPFLCVGISIPSHSAPTDQGGSGFLGNLFSHDSNKSVKIEKVQLAAGADSRVTDLQQQVRELTGKVEELNFMVLQMQEQIRQLQGGTGNSSQQSAQSEPVSQPKQPTSSLPSPSETNTASKGIGAASTPSSVTEEGNGSNDVKNGIDQKEAPKDLGSISFDKNGNVLNGSVNAGTEQGSANSNLSPTEVPKTATSAELYNLGYKDILSGNYSAAESVFRAFQGRYPKDPQIADATFWLGESLFGQKRYREAAQVYIDVQRNYKDSPRGPENLLKLGMSMSRLDEQKVACATFAEVTKRYKTVDPAVLKRVKDEQSRNKCQQ